MQWSISSLLSWTLWHRKAFIRAIVVGAGSFSGLVQSAGFALNETSTASVGTGFAGRASLASDASVMAANPAGLGFLKVPQWTLGGAVIATDSKLRNEQGTNVLSLPVRGDDGEPFTGTALVPNAYYAHPINKNLSLGFGVYVPFGLETDYGSSFVGRSLALKSHVQDISYQPTLSYRVMEHLSVGVGLFISHLEGTLSREVLPGMESKVIGDDWGAGVKLGVLWDNGVVSAGLSWTSHVDFKLEGDVRLKGLGLNRKAKAHLKFESPQMIDLGVSYRASRNLTLLAGGQWTGWSSFQEIRIIMDGSLATPGGVLNPGDVADYVPEKWKDALMYSLGASYRVNKQWLLRAGYAHDQTPTSDQFRTARIPDGDRNWLTLGARYAPRSRWLIDLAYGYMIPKKTYVNEVSHRLDGTTGDPTFRGRYRTGSNLFMASVVHRY